MPHDVMPDRRGLTAAQRRAVTELLRVSPVADELGRRFAGPGTSCTWSAARSATHCSAGSATISTSPPTRSPSRRWRWCAGWAEAIWETGREFGTIGAQRHGLRLEITTFRAEAYDGVSRNPVVRVRHEPARRPAPARLHGQRDGGQPARAPVHRPVRRPGRSCRPGAPHAGHAGGSRSPTTRCGCCARPGSPRSCGFTVAPDVVAAMTAMAGDLRPDHRRADPRRVHQAAARRRPVTGLRLLVDTGLAERLPARAARAAAGDRRARPAQGRLRAHADRGQQRDRAGAGRPGPRAAAGRAAARHRQAGHQGDRARRSGELPPPRGGRRPADPGPAAGRCAIPRTSSPTWPSWSSLHLRFYGYGRGEWTDSAVRRYVTDAGPLLDRLHKLTRSDCTTRNRRKAAQLSADYDALRGADRADRRAEEDLARVRPDLDGNAIMELLGDAAGAGGRSGLATPARSCAWTGGR